jgi:hypothetical protein
MEKNPMSKAIRDILMKNETVTPKFVIDTLASEYNITAEYRPVFGALRRITASNGKGSFLGIGVEYTEEKVSSAKVSKPKFEVIAADPKVKEAVEAKIEEEMVTVAVEEAPVKKAAKKKRKK